MHERASRALVAGTVYNYILTDRAGRQILNTLRPLGAPLPTTGTPALRVMARSMGWRKIGQPLISPTTPKQPIPGLQHQPLAADLAELAEFVGLEHAEGFAGVIGAHHIGGIEDIAQSIAGEAVEVGVEGIEFGPQQGAAFGRASDAVRAAMSINSCSGWSRLASPKQ